MVRLTLYRGEQERTTLKQKSAEQRTNGLHNYSVSGRKLGKREGANGLCAGGGGCGRKKGKERMTTKGWDKETATRFFFFLFLSHYTIKQNQAAGRLIIPEPRSSPKTLGTGLGVGTVLYSVRPNSRNTGALPLIPKILWATRASSRACEIPEAQGKRGAKHNVMVKIRRIGPVALGKEGHGGVEWVHDELWAGCSILGALSGGLQRNSRIGKPALAEEQQRGRVESRESESYPERNPGAESRHRLDAQRTGVLAESGHISSINTKMAIPGHGCFGKTN